MAFAVASLLALAILALANKRVANFVHLLAVVRILWSLFEASAPLKVKALNKLTLFFFRFGMAFGSPPFGTQKKLL